MRPREGYRFRGFLGSLVRKTLGDALLQHNGLEVDNYNSDAWFLAPFPVAKAPIYAADNLATSNLSNFRELLQFQSAKSAADSRWSGDGEVGRDISWRLHVAIWCGSLALAHSKTGECFIEMGTGRGYVAAGILDAVDWRGEGAEKKLRFFLMDTYLPDWQGENATLNSRQPKPFYYADGPQEVEDYFSRFPGVEVVQGSLPGSLEETGTSPIAFVHVDLNSAESEKSSLEAIRPRLRAGSMVLFDDSTNPGCHAQLEVHRSFAASFGAVLLELPTGQSILII